MSDEAKALLKGVGFKDAAGEDNTLTYEELVAALVAAGKVPKNIIDLQRFAQARDMRPKETWGCFFRSFTT